MSVGAPEVTSQPFSPLFPSFYIPAGNPACAGGGWLLSGACKEHFWVIFPAFPVFLVSLAGEEHSAAVAGG